jgi:hypothetical protein
MANAGIEFGCGRMNAVSETLYAWTISGSRHPTCLMSGSSLTWTDGEWHLWVLNWRSKTVEMSVDGSPLAHQDLAMSIPAGVDRDGLLFLGQCAPSDRCRMDELLVLNRPLDEDEIKWMYEQGMSAAKLAGAARR